MRYFVKICYLNQYMNLNFKTINAHTVPNLLVQSEWLKPVSYSTIMFNVNLIKCDQF